MRDITLFHGSRGGIVGDIKPQSRVHCDFGKGFYMGESSDQAKGLIYIDPEPMLYTVNLKLSEIPNDKILILEGMDWVYAVLANRQKVPEFSDTKFAKDWVSYMNQMDVVIGPIADDKMADAMRAFQNGQLTTDGLLYCLQHVQYGNQYVCKTDEACKHIEITSERELTWDEKEQADVYSKAKRTESNGLIQEATREFRNKGLYIDELIEDIQRQEKNDLENEDLETEDQSLDNTDGYDPADN